MSIESTVKAIIWSAQQAAFLDWCVNSSGSCVLEAVAGAGKTTVLLEAARRIRGSVAIMAYNRKIADEIKAKLVKMGVEWKKAKANTVHGFGMGVIRKVKENVKVSQYKVSDLLETMIPNNREDLQLQKSGMAHLISLAKQRALGVECSLDNLEEWEDIISHFDVFDADDAPVDLDEVIRICIKVLKASNENLDVIDYDDMVYLPLIHRLSFWRQDVIMVDEAQDTNRARRLMIRAMLKKDGRVIAVGDRHQAIYGFTGADNDSLELIAEDYDCIRLPLTITYRCPQNVVRFAHRWVKHIVASPTAPAGLVTQVTMPSFMARSDLNSGSAVLCRVTKPLVALAFKLIRQRIPCRVEGRDIANGIKKLMVRWKVSTLDGLEDKLEIYLQRETKKLLAKDQEAKLAAITDMVETIRVVIDQCRKERKYAVDDAVAYVDQIFGDDVNDVMVLSTIHKSKGREWPRVFWLDRAGTCPSPWARQKWEQDQELNLCYVAATRAQEQLIELITAS